MGASWLLQNKQHKDWQNLHLVPIFKVLAGSPSHGGGVAVYVIGRNQRSLPTLLILFLCLFLSYGPFNCISFHKFPRQLSAFLLCSSSPISALLVLSTVYLFMKVSFSPDIILCGWLGLKHQLTHSYSKVLSNTHTQFCELLITCRKRIENQCVLLHHLNWIVTVLRHPPHITGWN